MHASVYNLVHAIFMLQLQSKSRVFKAPNPMQTVFKPLVVTIIEVNGSEVSLSWFSVQK